MAYSDGARACDAVVSQGDLAPVSDLAVEDACDLLFRQVGEGQVVMHDKAEGLLEDRGVSHGLELGRSVVGTRERCSIGPDGIMHAAAGRGRRAAEHTRLEIRDADVHIVAQYTATPCVVRAIHGRCTGDARAAVVRAVRRRTGSVDHVKLLDGDVVDDREDANYGA